MDVTSGIAENYIKLYKIMNNEDNIERIAKELHSIIQYQVRILSDTTFKEKYDNLVEEIKYLTQEARGVLDNYKKEGLSISQIESEGYLRGMLTIKHLIED